MPSNDASGSETRRKPSWWDTVVGAVDAAVIIGGLLALWTLSPISGFGVVGVAIGYFAWIRRLIAAKYGPPLPWDRAGWREYNAE